MAFTLLYYTCVHGVDVLPKRWQPASKYVDLGARATQLWCPACNYKYEVRNKISLKLPPKLKEVDDVLGQEEAWANAQKGEAKCTECDNNEAYFMEIQTRSADEPATIFYRCTRCKTRWREG